MNKISIDLHDLYQFLISECRYGYTRNNHLMPAAAYAKVKSYIPKMFKADKDFATNTLMQLCEEAISLELSHFSDGEDDNNGNRQETIGFIKWCLEYIRANSPEKTWLPYNYDNYLENIKKDYEPRYLIYDVTNGAEDTLLTQDAFSKSEQFDVLCKLLGVDTGLIYTKEMVADESNVKKYQNYIYHINEPVQKDLLVKHI